MNPHLEFLLSSVYSGALAPEHRADLETSGLTPETIAAQGIRSVPPSMIRPLLGFDFPPPRQRRGDEAPPDPARPVIRSALLFPFPAPGGGWMDHIRMKVFPALTDANGHTVKYLQPKRSQPRLYPCRSVLERVLAGDERLWFVEGEKKSLAVAQLGLPAVGFCGVEGWHVRRSRALLTDFARLPLARRAATLVPDGDVQTNPDVERAVSRFARALDARGAIVRIAVLPLALAVAPA